MDHKEWRPEPKPKRNRRTPAQMAAARALENPQIKEDKPIVSDSEVL